MARQRHIESIDARGQSLDAIVESLDLRDPIKVPVGYQLANGEWRINPKRAQFIDSETFEPIGDPVSADYREHGFLPLLHMIRDYGSASGLELSRIYYGIGTLLAEYNMPTQHARKVGDIVSGGAWLRTGIEQRTAIGAAPIVLVCTNGMTARKDASAFSITHAASLSEEVLKEAGKAVEKLLETFSIQTAWLRRLKSIEVSPAQSRAMFRLLAQPATAIRSLAELPARTALTYQTLEPVYRELVADEGKAVQWDKADEKFPRNGVYRSLLSSWRDAPGADPGSLFGVYQAVTHYWSHGASGTPHTRRFSMLADAGGMRVAQAGDIIESYATAFSTTASNATITVEAE